jgi:EAL domain-containing protein (putative c-di-GMP-specific phosphodiesterase class I)
VIDMAHPSTPTPPITVEDILDALARDEFVYYYQPKVSLLTGKVCGAEALIRWVRPGSGLVLPGDFIPLAEASGTISKLSLAMFPALVADLVIMQDINPDLMVSFNLTAQDFESDAMVNCMREAIASYQIEPRNLQAELTETSLIQSSGRVREHIQALVDMGVSLAMDDYGTGYSSIDVLSQWPFSVVKIDQGLIRRMVTSEKSTTIVQASIRMAHQLGIKIVAEGIESAGVYDFLLNTGCTEAQGYWLGRPMPLAEFLAYLRQDQRWSGLPIGLVHMAQLDHIQWRRTLVDQAMAISFKGDEMEPVRVVEAEMNHRHCKLGLWYYGLGQEFKGYPAFDALDEPHRQLHVIGQELVAAMGQGASRELITELLRRLTRQSGVVLGLLQELENEALLERGRFMPTA